MSDGSGNWLIILGLITGSPFLIWLGVFQNISTDTLSILAIEIFGDPVGLTLFILAVIGMILVFIGFLLYKRSAFCIDANLNLNYVRRDDPKKEWLKPEERKVLQSKYDKKCNYKWRLKL